MAKFRVGDMVRLTKIVGDMELIPQLKVGKEFRIERVHASGRHYLIEYSPESVWYVLEEYLELAKQIPYGSVIRKIEEIKVRRNNLGYKY